jgi:hypothetical protein
MANSCSVILPQLRIEARADFRQVINRSRTEMYVQNAELNEDPDFEERVAA